MDNQNNGRHVSRTAIVARQLARYDIDIGALRGARFRRKDSSVKMVVVTSFSGKEHQWQIIEYME